MRDVGIKVTPGPGSRRPRSTGGARRRRSRSGTCPRERRTPSRSSRRRGRPPPPDEPYPLRAGDPAAAAQHVGGAGVEPRDAPEGAGERGHQRGERQFGQVELLCGQGRIRGFTMALAQEVARKGITVNTVSPGYIATDMGLAVPEEVRNKITAEIPIGRMGTPEEVAYVVDFLASSEAALFTGANLSCNGGQHMM